MSLYNSFNNYPFQRASSLSNNNTPTFFKINIDNPKNNCSNLTITSSNCTTNQNVNPFILNKKESNNLFTINNNNLNILNQCNNFNHNNSSELNNFENEKNIFKNDNSNKNFFSSNNNDNLSNQNLNINLNPNSFMIKENKNNFNTNPFISNINSQNPFSVNNNLNNKSINNYSKPFINLNNSFTQNNDNHYYNNNNHISNINEKPFNNNIMKSNSNINIYNNENIIKNFIPNNYLSSNNFLNFSNQNNNLSQNDRNYDQNNNIRNISYLNNQMNNNIGNNYSISNENTSNTLFQDQINRNLNKDNNNNQINSISNNQNQNLNNENNITNKNLISGNDIQNINQAMFPYLLNNDYFDQDTISFINSYSQFYGNYSNLNNNFIPTNFINFFEEKSKKKEISKNKIINLTFIKDNENNKIEQDENIKLFIQDLKSNKSKKEINKFSINNNNYIPCFFQFSNFNQYQKNKNRKLKIQNIKETISKSNLKPNTKLSIIPKQDKNKISFESININQSNKENEITKLKIEQFTNENLRDKFKHPIGNTPEKLKMEFNLININSYNPICNKYQLYPQIEKLSVMREKDLQSINNFSILSNDIKITFKDSVNLTNLNLDKFIISNNYDISIEDDKLKKILGPVIIEIYNIFLDDNNNEMILNSILSKFKTNEYKYNSEFKILRFETDLNKLII